MSGTRPEDDPRRPLTPRRRLRLALIGLGGFGVGVLVALIVFVVSDTVRVNSLAEANKTRLHEQASGLKEGLDILCKLKKYDLTTGLPALKARRERGGPEYDPARARVLEGALLLVLSIPSGSNCLAHAPLIEHGKRRKPPTGRALLRELEQPVKASSGAPTTQRLEREVIAPRSRGPRGPRGPAGPKGTTTPTPTETGSTPTQPTATVNSAPPAVTTPTVTSSTPAETTPTTTTPAPKSEPPVKARGRLCVEVTELIRLGC